MKTKELEIYYFCTPEINTLRKKYYSTFREMLGAENFFNNKKSTDEERLNKVSEMATILANYIFSNEDIKEEFTFAYKPEDDFVIGELVLQSVIADIAIQMNLKINIFKNKSSVLYFENTYPKNIIIYKNRKRSGNLFEYISFFESFKDMLKSFSPEELFGEEFVKEMQEIVREFKDKEKK